MTSTKWRGYPGRLQAASVPGVGPVVPDALLYSASVTIVINTNTLFIYELSSIRLAEGSITCSTSEF
jgi:hypothetical protein